MEFPLRQGMLVAHTDAMTSPRFVQLYREDSAALRQELALGLMGEPASVSPKFLYDALGSLTKASFDASGQLVATYSNGQTVKLDRLALASFNFLQGLRPLEGSLFAAGVDEAPTFGHAGEAAFGSVSADQVELANVDLAQEFSDLIVTQRGYQASSQVITTANEMIQQLYDMKARR